MQQSRVGLDTFFSVMVVVGSLTGNVTRNSDLTESLQPDTEILDAIDLAQRGLIFLPNQRCINVGGS